MKDKLITLIRQMSDDQVERLLADMDEADFCPKCYGINPGCHKQALLRGECFECWQKLVGRQEVKAASKCSGCKYENKNLDAAPCNICGEDYNEYKPKEEAATGSVWAANDTPAMEELEKLGVAGDIIGFEFEEEVPTVRACTTCNHENSPSKQHPCRFCREPKEG